MSTKIPRPFLGGLAVALLVVAPFALAADPPEARIIKDGFVEVVYLRFSPSGHELVRICRFGPPLLFDTSGYDKMPTLPVGLRAVAYSPDGTRLATAEGTDGARVWDATLPGRPMERLAGAALPDVHVLETPLKVLQEPVPGAQSRDVPRRVYRAEFSADGKRLLTTHADGHVKVWSTAPWALEHDLGLARADVRAAAFAPDGKTVVFGDDEGVLHEWSFEKRAEVWSGPAAGAVLEIAFAPGGHTLAKLHLAERDAMGSSVLFWDAARQLLETRAGFQGVAYSRDGKQLAIAGARIEFLDPATRKPRRTVELTPVSLREASRMFKDDPDPAMDRKLPPGSRRSRSARTGARWPPAAGTGPSGSSGRSPGSLRHRSERKRCWGAWVGRPGTGDGTSSFRPHPSEQQCLLPSDERGRPGES